MSCMRVVVLGFPDRSYALRSGISKIGYLEIEKHLFGKFVQQSIPDE